MRSGTGDPMTRPYGTINPTTPYGTVKPATPYATVHPLRNGGTRTRLANRGPAVPLAAGPAAPPAASQGLALPADRSTGRRRDTSACPMIRPRSSRSIGPPPIEEIPADAPDAAPTTPPRLSGTARRKCRRLPVRARHRAGRGRRARDHRGALLRRNCGGIARLTRLDGAARATRGTRSACAAASSHSARRMQLKLCHSVNRPIAPSSG